LLGRSGLPAGDRRPACRQLGDSGRGLLLPARAGGLLGRRPERHAAAGGRSASRRPRQRRPGLEDADTQGLLRVGVLALPVAPQARAMIPRLGLLSLAVAIPLAPAAAAFFPWIFGSAFQVAVLPAQILLVGLVAEGIGGIVTPYLYGEGRPGLNSLAMGAGLVV